MTSPSLSPSVCKPLAWTEEWLQLIMSNQSKEGHCKRMKYPCEAAQVSVQAVQAILGTITQIAKILALILKHP